MSSLLLLSGGMDSTLLAYTRKDVSLCVGFDYGQHHKVELGYAKATANALGLKFMRVRIQALPKVNDVVFAGRNALFLSSAAAIAQANGLSKVLIGCNKSDEIRFPDCRLTFIEGMNVALEAYGVSVEAPLLQMTKLEIKEHYSKIPSANSWSCYSPVDGKPCGMCLACLTRGTDV